MHESRLEIIRTEWQTNAQALTELRRKIFIDEQHVPEPLEWDGLDDEAIHLLARIANQPVGCARILSSGQIGRMAVLPQWRHMGIATVLLERALNIVKSEIGKSPFLFAQTAVQALYAKAGFHAVGETFIDAGIPHIRMELSIHRQ